MLGADCRRLVSYRLLYGCIAGGLFLRRMKGRTHRYASFA
jgi:hypothetical protein